MNYYEHQVYLFNSIYSTACLFVFGNSCRQWQSSVRYLANFIHLLWRKCDLGERWPQGSQKTPAQDRSNGIIEHWACEGELLFQQAVDCDCHKMVHIKWKTLFSCKRQVNSGNNTTAHKRCSK